MGRNNKEQEEEENNNNKSKDVYIETKRVNHNKSCFSLFVFAHTRTYAHTLIHSHSLTHSLHSLNLTIKRLTRREREREKK